MLHHANIITHVLFGTIALIIGFIVLFITKGNRLHVKLGWYYLRAVAVVIITGLIGVFIFKRNIFLLVVTILSGYTAFSGIRTLRLKGRKPTAIDYIIPGISVVIAVGYLYYLQRAGLFWSPVVTISIMSALFVVTIYDLLRFLMSYQKRKKLAIYEHVYKLISSLTAITSAFTGTVLSEYKPYSQFMPGVVGFACIFIYWFLLSRKVILTKKEPSPL